MKIEKQLIDMLTAIPIIQSELILQFEIYVMINLFKRIEVSRRFTEIKITF